MQLITERWIEVKVRSDSWRAIANQNDPRNWVRGWRPALHGRFLRSASVCQLHLPVVVKPTTSAFLSISKSSMFLISFSRLAPSSNCSWKSEMVRRYCSQTSIIQRRYKRQRSLTLNVHTFLTCNKILTGNEKRNLTLYIWNETVHWFVSRMVSTWRGFVIWLCLPLL